MPILRTLRFTIFYLIFAFSLTNATQLQGRSREGDVTGIEKVDDVADPNRDHTFSRLLSAVSPRTLHLLLHEFVPSTFRDGTYSSDYEAVQTGHDGNPKLASGVAHLAVRQGTSGNDTATSETPVSSTSGTSDTPSTMSTTESTTEPTTSAQTTPTETSTTATPSSFSKDTPTPSSSSTTTSAIPTSTTASAIKTTTTTMETAATPSPSSSSPSPSSASTSTSTSTSISSSSSAAPSTSSPLLSTSESSDMTSFAPSTLSMSITPTPTSKTSTFTSTLPGGAVTTVTAVTVVTPGVTEDGAAVSTSAIGNLQTGSGASVLGYPSLEILACFLISGAILI